MATSKNTYESHLVSIITPVYNAEDFLEDTILSVLNQTYTHFEYLLIDDQSTDRSPEIIHRYTKEDPRIRAFTLDENSGAAVARNAGLREAKGQYIAFIDSDDLWKKEKLEEQIDYMKQYNRGFTYTLFQMIDEDFSTVKDAADLPEKLDYEGLLKNTAIACSTVIIDREIIGDFRMPLVRKGQDTATWLRILKNHDYAYLAPKVLGYYRDRKGSLSDNKFQALKRTWNTYYHLEDLPFFQSIYYFTYYIYNAVKRRM